MTGFLTQFCPRHRAGHIREVTPEFLKRHGITALILDLDNTLVAWHGKEIAEEIQGWVTGMRAAGVSMCIVSNTHRPGRLKELAERLGVQWVPSGGKPRRRGFLRALESMNTPAEQTAVVGDQLFTDIWGGNRCGLLTILVEPLSKVEFIGTRVISRTMERLLFRRLERTGVVIPALASPLEAEKSSAVR